MSRIKKMSLYIVIALATCLFTWNCEKQVVKAETSQETYFAEDQSYIAEYVADISAYRGQNKTAPVAQAAGYEKWLFAGWYQSQDCKQAEALSDETVSGSAWAKYVPENILSVKCQVKSDAFQSTAKSTNMRLISSVDSLAYTDVGFEIRNGEDGDVIKTPTQTVFKRVKASEKSGVDFQYSPKVMDADANYFVTVTLKDILKKNFNKTLLVKPYWTTLDGTVVYGQSRYVKVSDGNTSYVNLTVAAMDKAAINSLSVEGKSISERRYFVGETYGALMVREPNMDELSSVTTYQVSDGTTVVYRNLYTQYEGNGDQSWYRSDAKKHVIITLADLYGFADIVNSGNTFDGKTVYMASDIVVNEGVASEWETTAPSNVWYPIGTDSTYFKGSFDGQNHVVSGVYMKGVATYMGFFSCIAPQARIQNLALKNSYIVQNNTVGFVGSIVADMRGNVDSLYSDAIVETCGLQSGGLMGRINGVEYKISDTEKGRYTVSASNCWFDGEVQAKNLTGTNLFVGGLIGVQVQGTANMSNLVFTGKVQVEETSSTLYVGGILGSGMTQGYSGFQTNSETRMNLSACISAGEVNAKNGYRGAIIGRVMNGISSSAPMDTYLTMENVYATRDCYPVTYNKKGDATSGDITSSAHVSGMPIQTYNTDRLVGYCVEEDTGEKLDFTNDWTMRSSGVPIPKTLAHLLEDAEIASVSKLSKEIGLDYWNGQLSQAVHYGVGNYVASYSATKAKYNEYIAKLTDLGFEKYVDNSATSMDDDGVYNVIYTKDAGDWVLHITFVEKESKIYISVNTIGKANLSSNLLGATQEGDADVTFAMLQLVNSDGYGNGFLFQLPNGHFIVLDGGASADCETLINYMRALSGGAVYIDAWVITHYHGDHCAAFNKLTSDASLRENVYLEAIYSSESSNHSKTSDDSSQITVANNAHLAASMLTRADGGKPEHVRVHMGERFYFNGVTMDVIQSQEQIPVASYDDYDDPDEFNATSITCLFKINKTGKTIYSGGDSTKVNMNYIMRAYDGVTATIKKTTEGLLQPTATNPSEIQRTTSKTLADVNVFLVFHHGKNTAKAFTRYLVGTSSDTYSFDYVFFPYHQLMNPEYKLSYNGVPMRYWMEDGSCVFDYKMEEVNAELLKNVKYGYYTYGYEDSVAGATADKRHGTVELRYPSEEGQITVRASWLDGFTMDLFQ